ncbi:type III polyketide synthase [Halalkalibacterium halodurans]|jgi:alkylresorcinol/alkylpyrone synthase|uniref:Naringenin-chalcone synthase n=2 Tax=Halalkalibacterium halodurans TaxID=86665 RepID=Q9KF69_HALH5|nr:type III polyketide synthase [Halalkalibacterium halodurans]MDY7221111.1 type III polyketide synthase [Halalkalibacterium halodurans]MDY7240350.1 type III polyketide synthase [Halalkalibacterium halodurans]MED4082754.1 type III polyketide synthase [Halalkalibacterium halodurans]MED4086680.1 type III polyketide synthase [Halalkalibacterium halodurans]MED4103256.1 type III polyketide synthase [Halalkalibacterium halodurans]
MASIVSVSSYPPPYLLKQETTTEFAKELFQEDFRDIERLLKSFSNGQIEERQFAVPLDWFRQDHSLQEKNDTYIKLATMFSVEVVRQCLQSNVFLKKPVAEEEIDTIVFVSSSGMATPSIEARMMNELPFSPHTKRVPMWGLGCAGGAAGMSRAYEYCRAFPRANVLVVCVELCSLTFQRQDRTKSNLIGASLFSDGVACALVSGDESDVLGRMKMPTRPLILGSSSTLMPDSEQVMGWDVKDTGLHVVFSRDIPNIIRHWLRPNVERFLETYRLSLEQIEAFIAHPGGRKVLEAYEEALSFSDEMTEYSRDILRHHGNMSSPTVLYVLEKFMKDTRDPGQYGLMAALGPGFCSELVLMQWEAVH